MDLQATIDRALAGHPPSAPRVRHDPASPRDPTESINRALAGIAAERRRLSRAQREAQVQKGAREELREHAATFKRIRRGKLTVKEAAVAVARDHVKADPAHYDRVEAVKIPKRTKGLKSPRLKLLMKCGKLRVYLVDSNAARKLHGDFTGGGHSRVYAEFIKKPYEVWIAEELFGIERDLYTLHELNEFTLMGGGMGYDEAHDLSTALEQGYRKSGGKGLKAAIQKMLRKAAAS